MNNVDQIVAEVASALSHLHQQGLFHGSVSTECCRLEKSGRTQLVFPVCDGTELNDSTVPFVAGSVADLAIRQRADLRSLGVVWYRLVAGQDLDDCPLTADRMAEIKNRLRKLEVSGSPADLILALVDPDQPVIPDAASIAERCRHFLGDRYREPQPTARSETGDAYRSWLARTPAELVIEPFETIDPSARVAGALGWRDHLGPRARRGPAGLAYSPWNLR